MSNEDEKPKTVTATHGFITSIMKDATRDGVDRNVEVSLGNDGNYYITIFTHWPDESEPMKTKINLTPDGLECLTDALVHAGLSMNTHPLPKE